MLVAKLKLETHLGSTVLQGEIGNISNLAAISVYSFDFEGRTTLDKVTDYPRWCESVMGLVARCLALTQPIHTETAQGWINAEVNIYLVPGGHGSAKHLAMAMIIRNEDDTVTVACSEVGINQSFESIPMRAGYDDAWSLAEHAMRVSVFGGDVLSSAKPLDIPVFESGETPYIRIRDIPEPIRTVFDEHMKYSGTPCVQGARDAVFEWDWRDFLGGGQ